MGVEQVPEIIVTCDSIDHVKWLDRTREIRKGERYLDASYYGKAFCGVCIANMNIVDFIEAMGLTELITWKTVPNERTGRKTYTT